MEQIARDIQIDLIMDNPNSITETFNDICKDLSVIEVNVYHNNGGEFIYYNKDKKWIFFRDDKNDRFWCHYDRYWKIFLSKFNINYTDVRLLTIILVEKTLNNTIKTPCAAMTMDMIDQATNNI